MVNGGIALLDCLGFKGIWQREDPKSVIEKLKAVQKNTQDAIQFCDQRTREEAVARGDSFDTWTRVQFLSDTIVVATWLGEEQVSRSVHLAVHQCCQVVSRILYVHAVNKPRMLLRGCVAAGEFIIEDNFIVGPAVDEAAEGMNLADGAIVWLTPKAHAVFDLGTLAMDLMLSSVPGNHPMNQLPRTDRVILRDYEVPLKTREGVTGSEPFASTRTHVINPMALFHSECDENLVAEMLATIGDSPELDSKRSNTEAFLRQCTPKPCEGS